MTAEVSPSGRFASETASEQTQRRLAIGFMNWAHALDHFVILIYPTVVIELAVVYGRTYASLIALATASFVAFGLFSLPAGWLADRWSRRNMMIGFYVGCGLSLIGHRPLHAWRVRGDLSSGRHRDDFGKRHPARPHHGVQRRVRQSRRLARRRHHRGADRGLHLARRLPGAGADLRLDRGDLFLDRSR
jgi:hypothetical protein